MLRWAAGVAALVLAVGLWSFEPWRLFTGSEVDEALPTASGVAVDPATDGDQPRAGRPGRSGAGAGRSASGPRQDPRPEAPPEVVELAGGPFEAAEHATSGRARVIELRDGSRYLRLDDLATSDGPDLHVWLTDQPSGGSWGSYDDGRYVALGALTATNGNQNYAIPADAELGGMRSAVIWCDRFDVAFGTAPISL